MVTEPRDREPAPRAASTVTDTEEGRAFFQARLSIFGFCLFALAGGSWALLALAYWMGSGEGRHDPFSFGGLLHLVDALLAGVVWLVTRRGQRTGPALHALDIGVYLGLVVVWVGAAVTLPTSVVGSFVALLSFVLGTLARAIVVPSTTNRTVGLGLVGGVSVVVSVAFRNGPSEASLGNTVAAACWATSCLVLAAVASRTIFGLRREVQRARVLGQYTLEAKIGEGGMGVVWRARHAFLRRPTAVKLLLPGRVGDVALRRFEREVQISARLTHPNSVAIYDYGRTRDGIFYYAMEFLEGTDLERLVETHGAQPPGRVVHVLTQVCGALAEAHDLGLVHRDVKPANLLLSPRRNEHEFAKVVDYGLVKSVDTDTDAVRSQVSVSNVITGTPLYMSPETILSPDSVDGRSDLYALGAVAWFLLVGRPPFEGETIIEVCAKHLHEPPPRPSDALGQAIAGDLEEIVLGCLQKRPEARPSDARELRARLERCSVAGTWTAARASEWWSTRGGTDVAGEPSDGARTLAPDLAAR